MISVRVDCVLLEKCQRRLKCTLSVIEVAQVRRGAAVASHLPGANDVKPYRPKPRNEIARNMAAIRSTENRTEAALRTALRRLGLRYRKYCRDLPGRPDIAFLMPRVAVFVDGDYWHGRLLIDGGTAGLEAKVARLAEPSRTYWRDKFTRRVQRDREITAALRSDGWLVLRFWESDLKTDVDRTARRIARAVLRRSNRSYAGATRSPKAGRANRRD